MRNIKLFIILIFIFGLSLTIIKLLSSNKLNKINQQTFQETPSNMDVKCPMNQRKVIGYDTTYLSPAPADPSQVCEIDLTGNNDFINRVMDKITDYPNLRILEISFDIDSNTSTFEFPRNLVNLSNLEKLSLSYGYIKEGTLPPSISRLSKLKELSLYSNHITSLPVEIGQLSQLRKLEIAANPGIVIPLEIGDLKNLSTLDLSRNDLVLIPDSIGNLTNLKILNISHNQLRVFPISLLMLSNLEELNMSLNKLTSLPEDISKLQKLKYIYFSNKSDQGKYCVDYVCKEDLIYFMKNGNQLISIPDSISQIDGLKLLDLTLNPITAENEAKLIKILPHTKILIHLDPPIDGFSG